MSLFIFRLTQLYICTKENNWLKYSKNPFEKIKNYLTIWNIVTEGTVI